MFGECHAHMLMDGIDYREAVKLHRESVCESKIREYFEAYRRAGVSFVRDGGDNCGVSRRAAQIAGEYGLDYRTPVFAIHKEGHYGRIVGRSFGNMREFHQRVREAAAEGADFIKIMTTGLLDFRNHGEITGTPLDKTEVKEMVHIAHEEGFAVMSHTNGIYGTQAAIEAGVDTLEHGNYMDEETLTMLADSHTVWVPTLVTVRNLLGCGRYEDETLLPIIYRAEEMVRTAFRKGVKTALGSDAGAYCVLHGDGICQEYQSFREILGDSKEVQDWLRNGEEIIRKKFRRS